MTKKKPAPEPKPEYNGDPKAPNLPGVKEDPLNILGRECAVMFRDMEMMDAALQLKMDTLKEAMKKANRVSVIVDGYKITLDWKPESEKIKIKEIPGMPRI